MTVEYSTAAAMQPSQGTCTTNLNQISHSGSSLEVKPAAVSTIIMTMPTSSAHAAATIDRVVVRMMRENCGWISTGHMYRPGTGQGDDG